MSHLPKMPVRFVTANNEILEGFSKSVSQPARFGGTDAGQSLDGTDVCMDVDAVQVKMGHTYRTAPGRTYGNKLFRRLPSGDLDYGYAVGTIVDSLRMLKEGVAPLNGMQKTALAVLFPVTLGSLDEAGAIAATAAVQLKLSPGEVMQLRQLVAEHLYRSELYSESSHAR